MSQPARHRFKTGFGQCRCLWCHAGRYGVGDCKVTHEMRNALAQFARDHGRTWKSKLRQLWENGGQIAPELQQFRNIFGPRRLEKLESRLLDSVVLSPKVEVERV